jgi:hypothetical protein
MTPEIKIKLILLDQLISSGFLKEKDTIINELTLSKNKRRVDLAVIKNQITYAFEIKSSEDSLRRLDGQVEDLSNHFDKVIVVTTLKHIDKVINSYPKEIGVWLIDKDSLTKKCRGRINKQIYKSVLSIIMSDKAKETLKTRSDCIKYLTSKNGNKTEAFWKSRNKKTSTTLKHLAMISYGTPKQLKTKTSNTDLWTKIYNKHQSSHSSSVSKSSTSSK